MQPTTRARLSPRLRLVVEPESRLGVGVLAMRLEVLLTEPLHSDVRCLSSMVRHSWRGGAQHLTVLFCLRGQLYAALFLAFHNPATGFADGGLGDTSNQT